ncbi:MAG: purine-nucleoside phosphorylase [Spirochaetia bacterium]|jgi:purine-nucleoside phosphorylase|nr:purine-nucleoside phosphorylase [Spirochaetia bacterium]
MNIPTPHIQVTDPALVATTVLMPGDPLRAKYIAETYLEDYVRINEVRNMFGYTGYYKKKKITVFASGMGIPSIGIYSYELFSFYNVERIIRIGSCGSYGPQLKLYDVVLASDAFSTSTYAQVLNGDTRNIIEPSMELNKALMESAAGLDIPLHPARVNSEDAFYTNDPKHYLKMRDEIGCKVVEMESFGLFANAQALGRQAACLLTVSDEIESGRKTTSGERQTAFGRMMEIALNVR